MQYDARYTQRHINTLQYDARYTQRHINISQYDARYTQRQIYKLRFVICLFNELIIRIWAPTVRMKFQINK